MTISLSFPLGVAAPMAAVENTWISAFWGKFGDAWSPDPRVPDF
jgi:hypothetical protein